MVKAMEREDKKKREICFLIFVQIFMLKIIKNVIIC